MSAALRIVVVGAGRGVGATVTAAAVADALAVNGVATALMVVAPPYACPDLAATSALFDAPLQVTSVERVALRVGRRASDCQVVALASWDPSRQARPGFFPRSEVPPSKEWAAAVGDVQVEVVDLGWEVLDGVGVAAVDPVTSWLCDPAIAIYPVLATAASEPGMHRLRDLVAGVDTCRDTTATVAGQGNGVAESLIVVTCARHDTAAALPQLLPIAGAAAEQIGLRQRRIVHLPEDPTLVRSGVPAVFSSEVLNAAADVLYGSGAIEPGPE